MPNKFQTNRKQMAGERQTNFQENGVIYTPKKKKNAIGTKAFRISRGAFTERPTAQVLSATHLLKTQIHSLRQTRTHRPASQENTYSRDSSLRLAVALSLSSSSFNAFTSSWREYSSWPALLHRNLCPKFLSRILLSLNLNVQRN